MVLSLGLRSLAIFFGKSQGGEYYFASIILFSSFCTSESKWFLESNAQHLDVPVPPPILPVENQHQLWLCAEAEWDPDWFSISFRWYEYVIIIRSSRVHQHMDKPGIQVVFWCIIPLNSLVGNKPASQEKPEVRTLSGGTAGLPWRSFKQWIINVEMLAAEFPAQAQLQKEENWRQIGQLNCLLRVPGALQTFKIGITQNMRAQSLTLLLLYAKDFLRSSKHNLFCPKSMGDTA